MSTVDPSEWIDEFFAIHIRKHPRDFWPDPDSEEGLELKNDWVVNLRDGNITFDEAKRASQKLLGNPPPFRDKHLPALLNSVASMRALRLATGEDTSLHTHAGCKAASVNCPHCHGEGLVIVYHPQPDPEERIAPTAAAHCVCFLGRWIRARIGAQAPELVKRFVCLQEVFDGRSDYVCEDPTIPEPTRHDDLDQFWGRLKVALNRDRNAPRAGRKPHAPRPAMAAVNANLPAESVRDRERRRAEALRRFEERKEITPSQEAS